MEMAKTLATKENKIFFIAFIDLSFPSLKKELSFFFKLYIFIKLLFTFFTPKIRIIYYFFTENVIIVGIYPSILFK